MKPSAEIIKTIREKYHKREELIKLRNEISYEALSHRYGVSATVICRIANGKHGSKKLSPEQIQWIYEFKTMREKLNEQIENLRNWKLAREYNLSESTVSEICTYKYHQKIY